MKYLPDMIREGFQDNLKDWCLGGPKKDGWTRRGFPVTLPPVRLVNYEYRKVLIDDALAKNRGETCRWHLEFLDALLSLGKSKFYWKKTHYYWEYLKPRYNDKDGYARANSFMDLFESILDNGVQKAVLVADVEKLDIGFQYFRFDGCHRMCCAKVAGEKTVPALVFKVERCDLSDLYETRMALKRRDLRNNAGLSPLQDRLL